MSQLIINIDNKEFEDSLQEFAKKHKKALEQVAIDAIKQFIGISDKKIKYTKKDVTKHMHIIEDQISEEVDLDNVKPYSHIEDSAKYIKELRRKRSY